MAFGDPNWGVPAVAAVGDPNWTLSSSDPNSDVGLGAGACGAVAVAVAVVGACAGACGAGACGAGACGAGACAGGCPGLGGGRAFCGTGGADENIFVKKDDAF